MTDVIVLVGIGTLHLVSTYTSPMNLPWSSMWTVNVIVDIPISNQRSLENVSNAFPRYLSARLKVFNRSRHSEESFGVGKMTYYLCTFSGFPSALRVSSPNSISALSSTDSFCNANLAAALRC